MAKPSEACQTCKIRRIKCDEAKPTCQRCTKSHRICIQANAVKEACFSIQIENRYASGKAKRPRGPRSNLSLTRPYFDLQTRALDYYFQNHLHALAEIPQVSQGLSEAVVLFNNSGPPSPMVDLAIACMALAVFGRRNLDPAAAIEASSSYCRLLRIAQERFARLPSSDERDIDACLLAITIMGRFESVTAQCSMRNRLSKETAGNPLSWSHHDGAMAILKVWYDRMNQIPASFIIRSTRRCLVKACLLRHRPLPDWLLDHGRFGEEGFADKFDWIFSRIVRLHYVATTQEDGKELKGCAILGLKEEAEMLEKDLQDWEAQMPSQWSYQRHTLTDPNLYPSIDYHSSTVYSFSKPGHTAIWSQYLSAKMLICSIILGLLELAHGPFLCEPSVHRQWIKWTTELSMSADKIASMVPFCVGSLSVSRGPNPKLTINSDADTKPYVGVLVVWPLTIASSIMKLDGERRNWFRSVLARLGRATGTGVFERTETDKWAQL
ncbi:hypothetical protein BJ875DRAFT_216915 [Amylocarpus encephaloides]|uniref:Zn(2)-C6 fungal-type domain-containing protein n=1 Tax=Amylocarpus encephaloides TaxID=45428 RepID=A0A9P7Y9H8_9HELO|nr:hypothetical protein BJ875DRAFT_216915 [Amylocarpus encephaloides]